MSQDNPERPKMPIFGTRSSRRLIVVILVASIASLLISQSVVLPVAAQPGVAGRQNPYGFRTLVNFPTDVSSIYNATYILEPSSGDWAAYTNSFEGCGPCPNFKKEIFLRHVIDDRQVRVRGAGARSSEFGDEIGVSNVRFADPYLIWVQPGVGYSYTPGQFACTLCYYNVASGKGGSIIDLFPDMKLSPGRRVLMELDPTRSGRALIAPDDDTTRNQRKEPVYLADLRRGELKEISIPEPAYGVYDAQVYGDVALMRYHTMDKTPIYLYDVRTGTLSQPRASAGLGGDLHTNGKEIFFTPHNPDPYAPLEAVHLQRYDISTGKVSPLQVKVKPGYYQVYGDLLAQVDPSEHLTKWNIYLTDLRTGAPVTHWSLATPDEIKKSLNLELKMSLSADKLLFSVAGTASSPPGQLYAHRLGIAWLTPADPQLAKVWSQADAPVAAGTARRSWLWGPGPIYTGWEPYAGLPGGKRQVQYFDKSRMEVNDPGKNSSDPFYVTNGLLVAEMIAGEVRLGRGPEEVRPRAPCTITVAGDPRKDNPLTPSYDALYPVASLHGDNQAPDRTGQFVNEAMDASGNVSPEKTNADASKYATYIPQTGHNIPDLFWTYLQGMRAQYGYDWTYAMGFPITEAYWTQMRVSGKDYQVMIQAYQRRVMTYTPAFPPEWRAQQGNVGQHYFEWRYMLNSR